MKVVPLLLILTQGALGPAGRTPAEAIRTTRPSYPREALRSGIEGSVVVQFAIDTEGKVSEASAEPYPGLDEAAVAAVKEWTFKPARQDGRPVSTRGRASVEFRIAPEKADAAPPRPTPQSSDLDLAKAVRHGEEGGEPPAVQRDGDICTAVQLTGPALRVARFARSARQANVTLRPEQLQRQAAGTLAVYVERKRNVIPTSSIGTMTATGMAYSREGTMDTCGLAIATSIVLQGPGGELLRSDQGSIVVPRQAKPRFDERNSREQTLFDAAALFDWDAAMKLAGGKQLSVVVSFSKQKPVTAVFDAEQLQLLTPDWAR